MPVRLLRTAVALAALALAVPAHAEEEGQGVNTGSAGVVVSTDIYQGDHTGTFAINGSCDYEGLIVPLGMDGGGQLVRFSGSVTAAGPAVPILANVTCEIRNASGNLHSQDFQLNGNTAMVAGSTLTDDAVLWPLRPITVCVSGKAVFGPKPVVEVTLTKRCRTPA